MSLDNTSNEFLDAYNSDNIGAAAASLLKIRSLSHKVGEPYPSDLAAMFCMKVLENIDQDELLKREYPGKYFKNTVTGEYEICPHNTPLDANRAFGRMLLSIKNTGTLSLEMAKETSYNINVLCGGLVHPDIPENDVKAYMIYSLAVVASAQSIGADVRSMPLSSESFPLEGWLPFEKEILNKILGEDLQPVTDESGNIMFFMSAFQSLAGKIQSRLSR